MEDKEINKLVDETLCSVDKIKRADAGDIQFDSIITLAKAGRFKSIEYSISFIFRAAAVVIIMLSLNMFTWLHVSHVQKKSELHYNYKSIENISNMMESNNDNSIN
jgi:hypothetical protein